MTHQDGSVAAGEGATKRKVGRPPIITRPDIERAGRQLASEGGLESVTVSALAGRLQVTTRALYHHIDGRDELRSMVVQTVLAEVRRPATDRTPSDSILQVLESLGSVLATYPGIAADLIRNSCRVPAVWTIMEGLMSEFCRAGLSASEAMHRTGALLNWQYMASVRDEVVLTIDPAEIGVDPDQHPIAASALSELANAFEHRMSLRAFERGLLVDQLIDSLAEDR